MDLGTFFSADDPIVATIVGHDQMSCVLVIDGTRRWFALEHEAAPGEDLSQSYLDETHKQCRRLIRLFFSHGLTNLILPVFSASLAVRGTSYMQMVMAGLVAMCSGDDWTGFYERNRVRVRFYGSDRSTFDAGLQAQMSEIEERTHAYSLRQLCFGVGTGAGSDAAEIARLAVQNQFKPGCTPVRDRLVELYYGVKLPPARLFVGFGAPCTLDFPLLADDGNCALYFMAVPTLYLNRLVLRTILYDYLYTRRDRIEYSDLGAEEWERLRKFFALNRGVATGVGYAGPGGLWFPQANIMFPDGFWKPT